MRCRQFGYGTLKTNKYHSCSRSCAYLKQFELVLYLWPGTTTLQHLQPILLKFISEAWTLGSFMDILHYSTQNVVHKFQKFTSEWALWSYPKFVWKVNSFLFLLKKRIFFILFVYFLQNHKTPLWIKRIRKKKILRFSFLLKNNTKMLFLKPLMYVFIL